MTENFPEPEVTDDETPDGTQLPTTDDLPDEEGDAGVADAVIGFEDLDRAGL